MHNPKTIAGTRLIEARGIEDAKAWIRGWTSEVSDIVTIWDESERRFFARHDWHEDTVNGPVISLSLRIYRDAFIHHVKWILTAEREGLVKFGFADRKKASNSEAVASTPSNA